MHRFIPRQARGGLRLAPFRRVLALVCLFTTSIDAQVSISATGTYSQSFDTLISSGSATWSDNSTLAGWLAQRSGTGDTIVAGTGSSSTGALYSFGAASASDRALGSIGSATPGNFAYGVQFQNNTDGTLTLGTLAFVGEQWRNSTATAQAITLSYHISSSAISSLTPSTALPGGWTSLSSLDFTSPVTGGTAGLLDGNQSGNRTPLSTDLSSITLTSGQFITFRWFDADHGGSDHGLAIDDFSLSYSASAIPEPSTYAAIIGALALSGAAWHRRRRKNTLGAAANTRS